MHHPHVIGDYDDDTDAVWLTYPTPAWRPDGKVIALVQPADDGMSAYTTRTHNMWM